MAKQKKHIRLGKTKNYPAGRGKGNSLIGRLVWYEKQVYQVTSQNKEGNYNLSNRTAKKRGMNVKRYKLRFY